MQTTKTLKVCSVFDPAIDCARTGKAKLTEYTETRDLSLLSFRSDRLPTLFHVRRIPVHTLTRVVEVATSSGEQRERAFMVGVERIENLYTPEGQLTQPRAPGMRVEGSTGETYWWSEPELDELVEQELVDRPTLVEIGGVALTRAGLRRGSARPYRLPPSLAGDLDDLLSRLVDTHVKIAPQSSEKPDFAQTT